MCSDSLLPTVLGIMMDVFLKTGVQNLHCILLPARASEQGNVIGSVRIYVTLLRKNGIIAGLAKIDYFPEKAFTKFKYCLRKI